ncbi:MAG: IS1380 family transposase [Undibacterium sp.]|nr:IS1380 family transposase [Undibacterium sp.]
MGRHGVDETLARPSGFEQALTSCGLPQPQSNRGYRPEQLLTQFMLSVWCGANRFEHGEVTRHDPVLKQLFGFKKMANFKAVMRLFKKFDQQTNETVMDALYQWMFNQININGITLDLDSTVMTRYGSQEGTARGYNPAKRGRVSRHPLMAFVADTRMIANCWLRSGDSGSANNVQGFLANTLHRLGSQRVALIRADSGFSDAQFLAHLEEEKYHYIIALKQNQPLQRALVEAQGWWALLDEKNQPVEGIELCRFQYQANPWEKPRWVIGIRQHIEKRLAPKGKTLNLFADDPVIGKYRFSSLVTDLDLPAVVIWRTYRGRADCENRIKELKYDFAADSFNMQDFWATEAVLNTVMLAYNLMSLMRQVLLKTSTTKHSSNNIQHTLQTLRYKLFAKPAYINTEARKSILNLALAMQHREWMQGLWDASKTFELPAKFTPLYSP